MSDFDEAARVGGPQGGLPNPEPKRIKVFGVLHLVFAGLGLIGLLLSLVLPAILGALLKAVSSGPGALDPYSRINLELTILLASPNNVAGVVTALMSLILVALLFIAGMGLVKRRARGLVWSNRYCWFVLGTVVIQVLLFLVFRKPMIEEFIASHLAEADGRLAVQLKAMQTSQMASGVLGPFVSMVYPIVALVMLNKPIVKNYFSAQEQ